jgi:phosphate transport system substrate-binding protein
MRPLFSFSCGIFALCLVSSTAAPAATTVTLTETGSSLLYPVITKWANAYKTVDPAVTLTTASTGSGAGIAAATAGTATIGASDAYSSDADLQKNGLLDIPVTISAQTITYNVPEIGDQRLQFTGVVLAAIYRGDIRYWDDSKILAINLHLAGRLPHATIVPIVRSDKSGDTFLFTQYLSRTDSAWRSAAGSGLGVAWPPVPGEVAANGNEGVLKVCASTKYAICYLGISYLVNAGNLGLYYAALANASGTFVAPTIDSISAAANAVADRMPANQNISLIYGSGDAYPLVNFEYAVVKAKQPDAATAQALRAFLKWAISTDGGNNGGNLYPGFTALPKSVAVRSAEQIDSIH